MILQKIGDWAGIHLTLLDLGLFLDGEPTHHSIYPNNLSRQSRNQSVICAVEHESVFRLQFLQDNPDDEQQKYTMLPWHELWSIWDIVAIFCWKNLWSTHYCRLCPNPKFCTTQSAIMIKNWANIMKFRLQAIFYIMSWHLYEYVCLAVLLDCKTLETYPHAISNGHILHGPVHVLDWQTNPSDEECMKCCSSMYRLAVEIWAAFLWCNCY